MIYWISRWILKIYAILYHRGVAFGLENFPQKGPFICVVNHNSNMDVIAMALAVKFKAYTMAKDSLFKVPVLGWWLKSVCMFPVARDSSDKEAFSTAVNILKEGKILFMAPEGTRRRNEGQRSRPRTGFVRIAQLTDCQVVPIGIWGTDKVLPPKAWFPKPHKIAVKVGKPLKLPKIEVTKDKKQQLQEQADHVMEIIYEMVDELEQKFSQKL